MSTLKKDLSANNWQLAINLSVAFLATLTLLIMILVNQLTYQSISKTPECVFVPWPLFQKPYNERPNPHKLDVLSIGSEQFLKRMYEYYINRDWVLNEKQSYYFSPVSVFLVMGYIASGLNPYEDVIDYGITSLEETLVGMSFPCLQSKLKEELGLLLDQEAPNLYITAYIDKQYNKLKLMALYPNTHINITRDKTKFQLLLKASHPHKIPTETYFSLETTSYHDLKFAFQIGIDIFSEMKSKDDEHSSNETEETAESSENDVFIISSKYQNSSMNQFHYTHEITNNSALKDKVSFEFLDLNDLTWKPSPRRHHLVENDQLMISDDNFVTFRCTDVTIHNITSAGVEVVILKNPENTNLTMVILIPHSKSFESSLFKERFSGTDFEKYEMGEGNDEFSFHGALTLQFPVVKGKTDYQLPILFQMNAITRIFYDGRDGDQFHKSVTDWYKIVGNHQKLHVPREGIKHQTSFDSRQVGKLFGIENGGNVKIKQPIRNAEWVPKEPLIIDRTFMFYFRSINGLIYQFGKIVQD